MAFGAAQTAANYCIPQLPWKNIEFEISRQEIEGVIDFNSSALALIAILMVAVWTISKLLPLLYAQKRLTSTQLDSPKLINTNDCLFCVIVHFY
jgi:hypothetical protein